MKRLALFLFAFATPPLLAAPVPKELKKEMKIEGTWKMVSCDCFGNPARLNADQHWTFDAGLNMTPHLGSKPAPDAVSGSQLLIDAAADPKRVDFKSADDPIVRPGIYELSPDGNTLKLCINQNNADRPTAVEPGKNVYLWMLQRAKPEAGK